MKNNHCQYKDIHPTEQSPLVQRQEEPASSSCAACIKESLSKWSLFYVLCFLSGQYINFEILNNRSPLQSSCKKIFSVIALIPFIGQIVVCIGYVGTAIAVEGVTIANVSYNDSSTGNGSNICTLPQEHWKFTTAITISTIAAFSSYSLMTFFVLIPVNGCCCCNDDCCTAYRKALRDSALSPYNDDDKYSNLSNEQTNHFLANYLVVLGLFICSFISSFVYAYSVYKKRYCWMNALYLAMIVLHLFSQLCAIQSCFIFSKIIYKVTNKLENLVEEMDHVNISRPINADSEMRTKLSSLVRNENDEQSKTELQNILTLLQSDDKEVVEVENENDEQSNKLQCILSLLQSDDKEKVDRGRYHWLQKMDQNIIKQVKPILKLFGYWFIFHWTFFALTTMLLCAFLVEIIIQVIEYNFNSVDHFLPKFEVGTNAAYVLYVIFFTLVHAYLFLYPCFRAAAIATARSKMIYDISKKQWTKVPLSIQSNFVQYLTSENFAFRVPLFCADIAFGFNWVYVSFFIAILGTYMKF